MRTCTIAFLFMAGIVGQVQGQTDSIIIVGDDETTEPPTMTRATTEAPTGLLTIDQVIAAGGGSTCRFRAGVFSACSATCEGTQTRDIFCDCTLSNGNVVQATLANCFRDDSALQPIPQRGCNGQECPTTPTATRTATTTAAATTAVATTASSTALPPTRSGCTWSVGDFSECSATCAGTQTRNVFCQCSLGVGSGDITPTSDLVSVADAVCENDLDNPLKPAEQQECGGECPVCRWAVGEFGDCSATCNGTQSRDVFCNCTQANGTLTTTDDVCARVSPSQMRPIANRICGPRCRDCDVAKCEDNTDCFDTECCLTVTVKEGKTYSSGSYCFPLINANETCDIDAALTCPCAGGLECRNDTMVDKKGKPKKPKQYSYYVYISKNNCPKLRKEKKHHHHHHHHYYNHYHYYGSCSPQEVQATTPQTLQGSPTPTSKTSSLDTSQTPNTTTSNTTASERTCNVTSCQDDSDCLDDECCVEVEYKEYKSNTRQASFCISLGDEGEVCDLNGNFTCPCRNNLNCTENEKHKMKPKDRERDAKYYRPKVEKGKNKECPELKVHKKGKGKKPKGPGKYLPTCEQPSGRKRRASNYDEETDDYNERPVVVFA